LIIEVYVEKGYYFITQYNFTPFIFSINRCYIRQIKVRTVCDFCLSKVSRGKNNNRWDLEKSIQLIIFTIFYICVYGFSYIHLFRFVNYIFLFLYLCIFILMYVVFCVLCCIVLFCILTLCKCELYYCHRLSTQLQLTNISYHVISNHDITPHQLSSTQLCEQRFRLIFYF
jgi:hypothetical protein